MKAILLALLIAAGAPAFPFTRYSDVHAIPVGGACGNQAMIVVSEDGDWQAMSGKDKDVFLHVSNGAPDYAYLTEGDGSEPIVVKRVLTYKEFQEQYPNP